MRARSPAAGSNQYLGMKEYDRWGIKPQRSPRLLKGDKTFEGQDYEFLRHPLPTLAKFKFPISHAREDWFV